MGALGARSGVGLVDLAGGLARRLDLPPGVRTWTDLAALAGRPDADRLRQALVEAVLGAGRLAWRLVVVDLPAAESPPVDVALAAADVLVAVGRCRSAGIGGVRAALDGWSLAGRDDWSAGAVITGARSRAPLAPREARAALAERLWALIPADTLELVAAAEDGMLLLDRPDLPAVQAMIALANRIVPFPEQPG